MSLKPGSVVQAAETDLLRCMRNSERAREPSSWDGGFEPYAFHRRHVNRAMKPGHSSTAAELLTLALADTMRGADGVGRDSVKPNTRMLYRDPDLLRAAIAHMKLAEGAGHDPNGTEATNSLANCGRHPPASPSKEVAAMNEMKIEDMPRWKCHKVVRALKISGVDRSLLRLYLDSGRQTIGVTQTWWEKHDPKVGGYYVVYDDAYASFSPALAFEGGYTLLAD